MFFTLKNQRIPESFCVQSKIEKKSVLWLQAGHMEEAFSAASIACITNTSSCVESKGKVTREKVYLRQYITTAEMHFVLENVHMPFCHNANLFQSFVLSLSPSQFVVDIITFMVISLVPFSCFFLFLFISLGVFNTKIV